MLFFLTYSGTAFATNTASLSLNGSQYAYILDSTQSGLKIKGDITIEAWIDPATLPSSGGVKELICKRNSSGHSYAMRIYNNAGTYELAFLWTTNGSDFTSFSKNLNGLSISVWTHVATTLTAGTGTIDFYKNGTTIGSSTLGHTTSIYDSNAPVAIGANASSTVVDIFIGLIDEVRIWNLVRTAAEIAANYNKELAGNEVGLVSWYRFNNDLTSSAIANTLTNVGGATFSTSVPFVGTSTTTTTTTATTTTTTLPSSGSWTKACGAKGMTLGKKTDQLAVLANNSSGVPTVYLKDISGDALASVAVPALTGGTILFMNQMYLPNKIIIAYILSNAYYKIEVDFTTTTPTVSTAVSM